MNSHNIIVNLHNNRENLLKYLGQPEIDQKLREFTQIALQNTNLSQELHILGPIHFNQLEFLQKHNIT